MKTIKILKNGNSIQEFKCEEKAIKRTLAKAINIAGGMWNGKDKFTVI